MHIDSLGAIFEEIDMQTSPADLIELETKFWQSIVDEDTETAGSLLDEPTMLVCRHGTKLFEHDKYRQMAEQGGMLVKSYKLSNMNVVFPSEDTAVLSYNVKQALAPRGKSS